MSADKFEMTAKTFQGLEGVLADELRELGAENIEVGRRMVSFTGDKLLLYRANYCLRTALRVLKPVIKFNATDADDLYNQCLDYKWDSIITAGQTFSIDTTVNSDDFRHSRFVTYRVKDAIVDWFNKNYNSRPSIRIQNADIKLNVHISATQVTISLDSSGESLHKRGYRVAQTEAPINEVLAAGLLKLSGWNTEKGLIDPMCGSGTFLLEGALMAGNIYPGVFRDAYAFERWRDFEPELFEAVMNNDADEREITTHFYGYDISPRAIEVARENVRHAGLSRYITLEVRPISQMTEMPENTILISNPPYGERLSLEDITEFYRGLGSMLKRACKGNEAWLIGPQNEAFDSIGLKPSIKFPVLNGSIECELRQYMIFEGTYAQYRKDGQSVRNEEFRGTDEVSKRYAGGKDRAFTKSDTFRGNKERRGDKRSDSGDDKARKARRERENGEFKSRLPKRPLGSKARVNEEKARSARRAGGNEGAERQERAQRRPMGAFRQPTLSADHEREIIHGRRKSWMRRNLDDSKNAATENSNDGNENK